MVYSQCLRTNCLRLTWFSGLDFFPTNIIHMRLGTLVSPPALWPLNSSAFKTDDKHTGSTLHSVALNWLREDRQHRTQEEKAGRRTKSRGPKNEVRRTEVL